VDLLVLESCHSTFVFDPRRMRFRRVLKGLGLDPAEAATEWRRYFALDNDPRAGSFVVYLDRVGPRHLRAWKHEEPCLHCGIDNTADLSTSELMTALSA
jgi:hypothetical protein